MSTYVDAIEKAREGQEWRENMRLTYEIRGYSDEEIDRLFELRTRLEFEVDPDPTGIAVPLPGYRDQGAADYLRSIPEDVILPDQDVDWLEYQLQLRRWIPPGERGPLSGPGGPA